jgi:hypothetical protein
VPRHAVAGELGLEAERGVLVVGGVVVAAGEQRLDVEAGGGAGEPGPAQRDARGAKGGVRGRGGRRGGRGRRKGAAHELEGTFDHGEEGYGLWLDPAVEDNPVYAEHWAGHRPVSVTIEENQIVIRRAGDDEDDD